ncbi:MAG TPA: DUF488 family protein [Acidimicrobiales bacterium]
MTGHAVDIIRVYDHSTRRSDDYRVLVDRLWPRGQTKDAVDLDEWPKDVAPSTELRRWYGHDPVHFTEFAHHYRTELALEPGAQVLRRLREVRKSQRLVLLTATHDIEHSAATVLREVIAVASDS